MIQVIVILLAVFSTLGYSFQCQRLEPNFQHLCHGAGYNSTFISWQNATEFRNKIYTDISKHKALFASCSKLSTLIVCSKYVPKCTENKTAPVLPCKDVCETFVEECKSKIEENHLKTVYTNFCQILKNRNENGKAARCIQFDADSSASEPKPITCYCDTCGKDQHFCQTNGSCFIQSIIPKNKKNKTERTCLHPGQQLSFVCKYSQGYPYARCCHDDYCNKRINRVVTTPKMTKSATSKTNHPITEKPSTHATWLGVQKTTQNTSTKYSAQVGIYAIVLAFILLL